MYIGRVIGNVVATIKHPSLEARKLMLVRRLDIDDNLTSAYDIAVDDVQAGPGDRVLVLDEGSSARQILGGDNFPIRAVIVGIVDDVDVVK